MPRSKVSYNYAFRIVMPCQKTAGELCLHAANDCQYLCASASRFLYISIQVMSVHIYITMYTHTHTHTEIYVVSTREAVLMILGHAGCVIYSNIYF